MRFRTNAYLTVLRIRLIRYTFKTRCFKHNPPSDAGEQTLGQTVSAARPHLYLAAYNIPTRQLIAKQLPYFPSYNGAMGLIDLGRFALSLSLLGLLACGQPETPITLGPAPTATATTCRRSKWSHESVNADGSQALL